MFKYKGNTFALNCCDILLSGHAPFTALYLYGPSGCGKTAMLNYIESESYRINPNQTIVRLGDYFYKSLDSIEDFSLSPEKEYIYMLDGIERYSFDFIEKDLLSEVLLSSLHKMNNTKGKIVITSDRSIDDLGALYTDTGYMRNFISRLKWEMTARITPTTAKERETALLEVSKGIRGIKREDLNEIIHVILETEGTSLGACLATLRRIIVRAQFARKSVTIEFAKEVIYENADIELIGA